MVSRSTLAVSFVVVLVLLSGCSSLLDPGPSDPSEFDYAAGYSADGVTDGQQALETYRQSLQTAGSYTVDYGYTIVSPGGQTDFTVTNQVDVEAQRAFQRGTIESPSSNVTTEYYYGAETLYQRSTSGDQQSDVTVRNQSFSEANLTAAEALQPLLTNASGYDVRLEDRSDETMVRYEKTDTDGAADMLAVESLVNVTSFQASLLVDSDGVVHNATYDVTYFVETNSGPEERSVSMRFDLSAIGETTVERPSWVPEA